MTTLDEFMAINPNAYMAVVDTWRPQTTQFKEAFDDYKRWAGAPAGTEWTGRTANAAYEAASLDCHGSDNADDAAEDIVTLASATITHEVLPPLNNGKTMIENALRAKDQGVSIDQSFNMSYTPPEGMSEETAQRNRDHVVEAERQIKEYVAKWEKGCQTLKGQADSAAQKITGCINPKTALVDGRKVLRDVAAPKPGDGPAIVTATSGKPHGYVAALQGQATETADGTTKPAGAAGSNTSIDYKAVYPKDVSVGDKNVDPSKLGGIGSIPGTRDTASGREPPAKLASALKPQDVPAFKEMTREKLTRLEVPADQIEAQVNKAVEDAQTPRLVRTDVPSATPSEHVSRDFGEQFNRFTNGISDSATKTVDGQIEQAKILTGQAGPGAPGVAEAWKQVGLGAVQQAHELTTDPLAAPKMGIEQAKDFYNNPSDFIGKNIIHGTEAAVGGVVGGEVAAGARGLLGDLTGTEGRALTHGIEDAAPGHHSAPSGDHTPAGGHSGGTHTPQPDLNHVSTESGGPGGWNQELNKPAPNTLYNVDDRFHYNTDDQSRVGHAHADLDAGSAADRNGYQQRIAGGPDRLPGDEGGHIFGSQFGGPGEAINITAMRDTLNSVGNREYYNLEGDWRTYLDEGKKVSVEVDITYPGDSRRPAMYAVKTYVDGNLDSVHSFRN